MTMMRAAKSVLLGCLLGASGLALMPMLVAQAHASSGAAAPTPEMFGQRVKIFDAAISPNGRQIAQVQNVKGQYIINIIDLDNPTAEPRVLGLGKGVSPKYVRWVNDARVAVSFRQISKLRNEPVNASFLHSIDVNTMKGKTLIKVRQGFRQFNDRVVDWLEDDPDHILMEFADDGDDQMEAAVWRVDARTGNKAMVKRSERDIYGWVANAAGEPVVGWGRRNAGQTSTWLIKDPTSEKWDRHSKYPGLDPDSMSVAAVTDEGRSLVVSAYRGRDTLGLYRYDLTTRSFAEAIYQNDEYDVTDVILSKDGNSIVGARYTGESDERVLFDSYGSTLEEAIAEFAGYQVDFIDRSADGKALILRVSSPSDPGVMMLYRRGGKVTILGDNMPGLDGKKMGEVISVRYTARDGTKIPAFVTVPSAMPPGTPKDLPFIVLPHGGPAARDEKRFDYLAQFFASRGYGVLQMNFRGSEGYGKSFADAGQDRWVTMQDDVEDGTRWLFEKGYADPEKTCIAGWSYGGYAALMGASKDPELYNCVIAIAALTDIPDAISDLRRYVNGRETAKRTFGNFMDDKDLMRANNPVDLADTIKAPVFMAHGTMDTAVEHDQFHRMKKRLEKAGADGTYLSFEGEDHSISNQANRQKMLKSIDRFLTKHNGQSQYAAR